MANKLYKPILIDSILATEKLTEKRFVGFDGSVCAAGEKAIGVCDVTTEQGEYAPIGILGIFLVEAGGTITQGSEVTSDVTGKAVAVADDDKINGYALDSATADGDIIRIARGI